MELFLRSLQILEIICNRNVLRLGSPKEVFLDRVGIVSEGNLDRTRVSVQLRVARSTLVRLMLLHQRQELFGGPALCLEVVVVRCRGSGVHLEDVRRQINQ